MFFWVVLFWWDQEPRKGVSEGGFCKSLRLSWLWRSECQMDCRIQYPWLFFVFLGVDSAEAPFLLKPPCLSLMREYTIFFWVPLVIQRFCHGASLPSGPFFSPNPLHSDFLRASDLYVVPAHRTEACWWSSLDFLHATRHWKFGRNSEGFSFPYRANGRGGFGSQTAAGTPEKPWKADCGYCDRISQNANFASAFKLSLNAGAAKRGRLGRGKVFAWPPADCPPERPRPSTHYCPHRNDYNLNSQQIKNVIVSVTLARHNL